MDVFRTIFPEEFLATFLEHQVRPDGRAIDQVRKTAITTGSITTAYGSAMVKLGGTSIIGGVQAQLVPCKALSQGDDLADGDDADDEHDEHNDTVLDGSHRAHDSDASLPQLVINVELPALCSPQFRPGKPSELQQSLCHRINTLAKAAKLLDTEELCVRSAKGSKLLVWCVIVDLYCLDNDGSLFDACVLALVASLRNTHLPVASLSEDGSRVYATPERPIALAPLVNTNFLVPLSFAYINGKMLADPTADEEQQQQAGVTVIVLANSNVVCSADKYGGQPISLELLTECIARTRARATEVVALLNKCS